MTDHISYWLRDLGVVKDGTNIETEFANGYKFGLLLKKLDIIDTFDEFKNKSNKEWKVKNFAEVERGLRYMKLKFESKIINQIMEEERGAALRLLFQIKLNREEALNPSITTTGLNPDMLTRKLSKIEFESKNAHSKGLEPTIKSK